jgi:enoyl-[acyl-carrier protein] reductase II
MKNRVTELFSIKYPVIQGGMIWNSGWRLASAVSNAGGLGLIGAGSMYPEVLKLHIERCKAATNKPFGVNVPLLYPNIEEIIELILEYNVPIVFTSAGNPATHTARLKAAGITVVHVVSSTKFALKAEAAGVDAIVAEGFEAGGHNGREESTTLTLIPSVRRATDLPLIAAGGIATGEAMLATMILGADGVQMGSRFVASEESSGHQLFKDLVVAAGEGATELTLKELTPVRLLKNKFYQDLQKLYQSGASTEELRAHLGRARAKRGMFEGDLEEGELEIGQIASMIDAVKPAASIIEEIMAQYHQALRSLPPRFSLDQ